MHVVVVGAGLAGLRAAGLLRGSGCDVSVLERSSRIGGRVDTETVEGFLCDRGFQLFNPAYPQARRALDLRALDLHRWGRGVAVRRDAGLEVLADPSGHPSMIPGWFRGDVSLADFGAAVAWLRLAGDRDLTLAQSIDEAGFSRPTRRVIEKFFAGVVADERFGVSASFARRLAWYFAKSTPTLPAQGMIAIAQQLAEPVRDRIRLDSPVAELRRQDDRWVVVTEEGPAYDADRMVLAAGPRASARLLGRAAPEMHSLTTWWFSAERRPSQLPFLNVDIRDGSRSANTCVVSNVCRSYAPAGRHLVQATAVGDHGMETEEALAVSADVLGASTVGWQLLVRHEIRDALPNIPPGGGPMVSDLPGVVVAGDTGEASIQGALASAATAARRISRRD